MTPAFSRWLHAARAVFRHEWRVLAHAPMSAMFLAGFLLTLSAAIFLAGDFYATDHVAGGLLWTFLPWAALVFVPALAMSNFADGPGDRALELMLSLPLPTSAVVAGKWLAGLAMLAVALGGTLPFVATLAYLGAPDWGALSSGYLGALMLLGAFYAVALLAAALARDPFASYVLGLVLLLGLLVAGWDATHRLAYGNIAAPALTFLASLSPKAWLDRMATGQIDVGAVAAFAVLSGLGLAGAHGAVSTRRTGGIAASVTWKGSAKVAATALAGIAITHLASRLPLTTDLTVNRAYSLHSETLAVVRDLPPGTTVDLYWSAEESRVPAAIRAYAQRITTILQTLAARSGGKLTLRHHDPRPDSDAEFAALSSGVRRVPLSSGDQFYLGAVFKQGERLGRIAYFDARREQLLEYDIALALANLARARTPRIGLISPLLAPSNTKEPREGLALLEELKQTADIAIIPYFADGLPDGLDAVVVIGATILKREMLYSIDQHVMHGKGLVVLIDPHARFSNVTELVVPQPSTDVDDISDLLLKYGLRFDPDKIVGDSQLASLVVGGNERHISYPFWPRLGPGQLARGHAVTTNLNEVMFAEPGSFEILAPDHVTALASTTTASGHASRQDAKAKAADLLAAEFRSAGTVRTLAAAIHSVLDSAFKTAPTRSTNNAGHRARSSGTPAVMAVADIDFLFDPVALQNVTQGNTSRARPINDNMAFFFNMIEYAAGDPRLLAIRSRSSPPRSFTRVAAMLGLAQERHRVEEQRLLATIGKIEGDVRKIVEVAGAKDVAGLPKPIQERIGNLLKGLEPYRRELRRIRAGMREDVERLGTRLTMLNLASGPAYAGAFAAFLIWRRRLRAAR